MIVNYLKLPLQVFVWDNITWGSLAVNLIALPFLVIGAVIGIKLVKKVPESGYRKMILWLSVIATAMLLI